MTKRKIKVPKNYTPRPFQKQVHEDEHRFKVLKIHRRYGKTSMAIAELIMKAVKHPGTYYYVMPVEDAIEEHIWGAPHMLFNLLPESIILKKSEAYKKVEIKSMDDDVNSKTYGQLCKKSVLLFRGANNHTRLRGGDCMGVILDEYAHMKDAKIWEDIFSPMLASPVAEGRTAVRWAMFCYTPKRGALHARQLFLLGQKQDGVEDSNPDWISWSLTAEESGVFNPKELEDQRKRISVEAWLREYMVQETENQGAVFKDFNSCVEGGFEHPVAGRGYFIGLDVARLQDYTVVTVFDPEDRKVVFIDRFTRMKYPDQAKRVRETLDKYPGRIWIEYNGQGIPLYDELTSIGIYPKKLITTSKSKEDMVHKLELYLEKGVIKLPNYQPLLTELETFEQKPNGKYGAPGENQESKRFFDDCVMSLMFSLTNTDYVRKGVDQFRKEEKYEPRNPAYAWLQEKTQKPKVTLTDDTYFRS